MKPTLDDNSMDFKDNVQTVDYFCDSLWLEDGLSKNTLSSYRRDLYLFSRWLKETQGVMDLSKVTNGHILGSVSYTHLTLPTNREV